MGESRAPALIGSLALHLLVFGAGFLALPFAAKTIALPDAVPVTIVSRAPPETPSASAVAPAPTPAATPDPVPTPTPEPKPEPQKAAPKPLDLSKLAASLPEAKPKPAGKGAKPIDLAALAASLPKSAGAKGPPRPAAAPVVNPGPVRPLSGDEMGALQAKLMRLWNPNCGAEGAGKVVVRVEFHLSPEGRLIGQPQLLDRPLVEAGGPVVVAAAQRAVTAVVRGEPYVELPRDRYAAWKDVIVRFNAKEACASG